MTAPGQPTGERRLAAIMFTDMVGYTAVSQRDEALAIQLLEEQRTMIRACLATHSGRVVDTIGDGFLVEFTSSLSAVRCAVEIQSVFRNANGGRPEDRRLLVRIGIHLGDVVHRGDEVAGDAVNLASRIEPLAWPGGICVTAPVRSSVTSQAEFTFESLGKPNLKNVANPIEVFRLMGFGQPDTTRTAAAPSTSARVGWSGPTLSHASTGSARTPTSPR